MNLKRLITGVVGLPIVIIFFIISNKYIFDIFLAIIALRSIYEFKNSAKSKYNVIGWIAYIAAISIAFIHFLPQESLNQIFLISIFGIIIMSFIQVIITEMKTTAGDVAVTFLGIIYIVGFMMNISLLYGLENGKI